MSKGVRKRLRRSIKSERAGYLEQGDTVGVADCDALLEVVERLPTGQIVPDDWDASTLPEGHEDGVTDAERVMVAISYYGTDVIYAPYLPPELEPEAQG